MTNYFTELNSINVSDKTEMKNGLTYLSWAWAWGELKKKHPEATYTIHENAEGWNYHTDGRYGWVKTGVTVNEIEHIEYLPILNYANKPLPLEQITSFNVNTSIQRSLTKAVARHGLGLYIYAGEDIPDAEKEKESAPVKTKKIPTITSTKTIKIKNPKDPDPEKVEAITTEGIEISENQLDEQAKAGISKKNKQHNKIAELALKAGLSMDQVKKRTKDVLNKELHELTTQELDATIEALEKKVAAQ